MRLTIIDPALRFTSPTPIATITAFALGIFRSMQQSPSGGAPLSVRTLIIFSLLNIPLAGAMMPVYAYLPQFYAQQLGSGLGLIGSIFMISRTWNALLDPLIGVWSDRTRSRWGRRKPWIAAGGIVFLLASYALFVHSDGPVRPWYLAFWLFLFYLGWTMATIPLAAWGGELSERYHERSRVQSYVQVCTALGLLLVLLIPALLDWLGRHDLREKIVAMGWFMIAVGAPTLCANLWLVRDDAAARFATAHGASGRGAAAGRFNPFAALRILVSDRLLLRVMIADFAVGLGQGIRGSLFLFFVIAYAGLPQWASSLWLMQFVFGVFAAPIWLRLSYRIGKHRAAVAGELLQTAINLCLLLVGRGDLWLLFALGIAQGLAQNSGNLMLRAMVADVADLQKLRSGEERAGLLFSLFNMTNSLAMALAVAVAFGLAGWFGYAPGAENGSDALRGLLWVFALGPALCHLLGALLVWNFPLDQRRHAQIRNELAAARRGAE